MAELLHQMDYSLQGNRKTKEGTSHPDRNAQFEHIHDRVQHYIRGQQPVISVDTEEKGIGGRFQERRGGNGGRRGIPSEFVCTISGLRN